MIEASYFLWAVFGAFGGLARGIMGAYDKVVREKQKFDFQLFSLSVLYAVTTGAMAGILIDGSPTTALISGYAGSDAIEYFLRSRRLAQA